MKEQVKDFRGAFLVLPCSDKGAIYKADEKQALATSASA